MFDITNEGAVENFGYHWTGLIEIPADDSYTFFTASDDGSRLYIGENLVVDNNSDVHQRQSNSVNESGFRLYLGENFLGDLPRENTSNENELGDLQSLIIGHNNESFSFEAQPTSINRVDTCEGVSSRIYRAVDLAGVSKTTIVFDSEFLTGIDNEKDYYFISSTTEDLSLIHI